MRKSMPLRWIEEAEARQVLAAALHETAVPLSAARTEAGPTLWREMVRRWLFASDGRDPEPSLPPALTVVYTRDPRPEPLPEAESLYDQAVGEL